MVAKRYQVFISSTYEDLKDERKAVEETVLRAGDIPVGMEAFPAADEEQFEFIKSVIDNCDYYVLIIAGRYGSLAADGKSYTEKEYDYAVSVGVPVLFLLRSDLTKLSVDKSEALPESQEKLRLFIVEASTNRIRKNWSTVDGLKLAVREALDHAKVTKVRPGWVRGNLLANSEVLEELALAQRENLTLKKSLGGFIDKEYLPDIPAISDTTTVHIVTYANNSYLEENYVIRGKWIDFFTVFFSTCSFNYNDWGGDNFWYIDDDGSRKEFATAIFDVIGTDTVSMPQLTKNSFEILKSYFIEAEFLNSVNEGEPFTTVAGTVARRQQIANVAATSRFEVVEILKPSLREISDEIPF
ncbi:MAG: DUF4062 domain-containing protein [Sulfitobacter sp.]|uniref:DUF4062 domain-containing protein n=1 Tax=Sulfitobacter sp. TaxID=1903071 RepID=UPI0030016AFE